MNTASLNQVGVSHSDIIAHVSRIARIQKEDGRLLDTMALGQALRDELPLIAGHVSDESFAVLVGVCAALMNNASENIIADAMAKTVVAKAKANRGREK
jgi:D-alanyl-D-alanine carboxypeptidase